MKCPECGGPKLSEWPCPNCNPWETIPVSVGQTRLLDEPCARCGHKESLLIEQHDGMVCVNCITNDNGEDGDDPMA